MGIRAKSWYFFRLEGEPGADELETFSKSSCFSTVFLSLATIDFLYLGFSSGMGAVLKAGIKSERQNGLLPDAP